MNKINNQFTSIEQITDRYLGTGKGNLKIPYSILETLKKTKEDL